MSGKTEYRNNSNDYRSTRTLLVTVQGFRESFSRAGAQQLEQFQMFTLASQRFPFFKECSRSTVDRSSVVVNFSSSFPGHSKRLKWFCVSYLCRTIQNTIQVQIFPHY